MKRNDHVWIIGGGLSGLAAAAALRNIVGLKNVIVLERLSREEFYNTSAGAAAQLGPNGLRALGAIGGSALVERILREGDIHSGTATIAAGNVVKLFSDATTDDNAGLPQVLIRWGVLRSLLLELLPSSGCIYTGSNTSNIASYNVLDDGSVLLLDDEGNRVGPSHLPLPSLVIAADGIGSSFQTLVYMDKTTLPKPNGEADPLVLDNGRVNIKAVVPKTINASHLVQKDISGLAFAHMATDGSIACFAGPVGCGYTYWAVSVADAVGISADYKEDSDSDSDEDSSSLDHKKRALLKILEQHPQCQFATDLIKATHAENIHIQRSRQLQQVGPNLASKDGKIVLVGDAAHAMSPAYGQAANFAFEDAATLAVLLRNIDRNTALDKYSACRVSRCREMARRSAERMSKAAKGEQTEDVFKWIFAWDPQHLSASLEQ